MSAAASANNSADILADTRDAASPPPPDLQPTAADCDVARPFGLIRRRRASSLEAPTDADPSADAEVDSNMADADAAVSTTVFADANAGDETTPQSKPQNSFADDSSSSSAGANSDETPPAAVPLPSPSLESVFAFLNLREAACALQVSRSWLSAVRSMAPLRLPLSTTSTPLHFVGASVLSRHIDLVVAGGFWQTQAKLGPESLLVLSLQMPHLRHLQCALKLRTKHTLRFPPQLRRLNISFVAKSSSAQINEALQSVGRLEWLEELTISLPRVDAQVSYTPLAALPRLRHLRLQRASFDGDLCDALLSMPLLREVALVKPKPTAALLRRLLVDPRPRGLQWQQLTLPEYLDDECAALLPLLPSLTHAATYVTCVDFEWLCDLPRLVEVVLDCPRAEMSRADSMAFALQHCTAIERLSLRGSKGLKRFLPELLAGLPRLRELTLKCMRLRSLSFLAEQPTASTLTALTLAECAILPLDELRHVRELRALTSLELLYSFAEPMDADMQALYSPPSSLLPRLQHFHYIKPIPAAAAPAIPAHPPSAAVAALSRVASAALAPMSRALAAPVRFSVRTFRSLQRGAAPIRWDRVLGFVWLLCLLWAAWNDYHSWDPCTCQPGDVGIRVGKDHSA